MLALVGLQPILAAAAGNRLIRRNGDRGGTGRSSDDLEVPSEHADSEQPEPEAEQAVVVERTKSVPLSRSQKRRIRCLSCLECIVLLPLFGVFMILQYTHLSLATSYKIERVLKFEFISKKFGPFAHTVSEVHDAKLFWEWLETLMNETLAVQSDQLGHQLPKSDWGYLVQFNKVVGGVRLVQDRGQKAPCGGTSPSYCYSYERDSSPFGYPRCSTPQPVPGQKHPGLGGTGGGCFYPGVYNGTVNVEEDEGFTLDNYTGHFEMWLDTKEPRHTLQKRVEYLEDRHWIDKQTREITIELFIRNDQYEPLVSEVIFQFSFDLTGYIREEALVETIPADPYSRWFELKVFLGSSYVLWNVLLVTFFVMASRQEAAQGSRRRCCGCGCKRLFSNSSEGFSVFIAVLQMTLWAFYVPMADGIHSRMEDLHRPKEQQRHDGSDEHLWVHYHHEVADIEARAKNAIRVMMWMRELSAITVICLLLRHFRVWNGIPAFATVSRTLELSFMRLGAVLLAGLTVVAIFAGAATINYGTQMAQFHTMALSIQETAVIAITGDPAAYEEMSRVDPVFAALWFWALIAVMFMVVLNMILGILVDAAASAQQGDKGREPDESGEEGGKVVEDDSLHGQVLLTLRASAGVVGLVAEDHSEGSVASNQKEPEGEEGLESGKAAAAVQGCTTSTQESVQRIRQSAPALFPPCST